MFNTSMHLTQELIQTHCQHIVGNIEIKSEATIPFDRNALAFLSEVSRRVSQEDKRRYPDLAALCFWLRKKHLVSYQKAHSNTKEQYGIGLVFHIAPNNVPLNFFYSYAVGLLSGNSNVVKLPSQQYEQVDILMASIQELFQESEFSHIYQRTLFVQYNSENSALTESLSRTSQARVIWGGDDTVQKIKQIPSHPRCIDIAFANRHSIAVINPFEILALDNDSLSSLVERFYHDAFVMNQRACSSPKIIVWTESEELDKAQQKFWLALEQYINTHFTLSESESVAKYTQVLTLLAKNPEFKCTRSAGQKLYRVSVPTISANMFNLSHNNGIFLEICSDDLSSVFEHADSSLQTVTYFGVDPKDILGAVTHSHCLGVDRIVPFGQALEFDVVWDGINLLNALSRIITIN